MEKLKPIKMLIIYSYISVIILLLISIYWYIQRGEVYAIIFAIMFFIFSPMRHMLLGYFASISYDENIIRVNTFLKTNTFILDQEILSYSLKLSKRNRVEEIQLNGTDKFYKFRVSIYKFAEIQQLIEYIDSKYKLENEKL